MAKRSQIYEYHSNNGKLTEFAGYDMPVWYSGIIEEHDAVRNAAGLFDVSHMGRVLVQGEKATDFLDYLLPSNVAPILPGRAFYSTICNEKGGILDDVIVGKFSATRFLVVVNASNRMKDLNWMLSHSRDYSVSIEDITDNVALIAFQGPEAIKIAQGLSDVKLEVIKRFAFIECYLEGVKCIVSRTGYTGEDGIEIAIYNSPIDEPSKALKIWNSLLDRGREKGVLPCGLGARDLLRLEAGMCLYGQDIDENTTPLDANLESVVDFEKPSNFLGRDALKAQSQSGGKKKRAAFQMIGSGIPRHGYDITLSEQKIGAVTSGTFSPSVGKGIGMGYVPPELSGPGHTFSVSLRNTSALAETVTPPFYDTSKFGFRRKSTSH